MPAMVTALVASSTLLTGGGIECFINAPGRCAPSVDQYGTAALLVGAELRGNPGSVGLMIGPTAFNSETARSRGAHALAEIVTRRYRGVAAVIVPRFMSVPNVHGATHTFRSVSVGLRIR